MRIPVGLDDKGAIVCVGEIPPYAVLTLLDARQCGDAAAALARDLAQEPGMAELKTPIVVTIIGEGGSGGALAIAVGDVVQMLQYSTYSVISPEGCASILWKSASKANEAAETMRLMST